MIYARFTILSILGYTDIALRFGIGARKLGGIESISPTSITEKPRPHSPIKEDEFKRNRKLLDLNFHYRSSINTD